ncbi:unnamed protein product, partial [Polarella glacialis]
VPPGPAAAIRLRLDGLHADDLCLRPEHAARIACRSGVAYQEIWSSSQMTICIFLLRAGARIPLHDHPGMRVFGRLLFGRMRVLSFDLAEELPAEGGAPVRAKCYGRKVLGPEPVTYGLGPEEGNVHELQAIDHCAFFDILTPPYDVARGRDCTYYRCLEDAASGGYFLEPMPMSNFRMEMQ